MAVSCQRLDDLRADAGAAAGHDDAQGPGGFGDGTGG
jgi:hypothetical protein